MIGKAALFVQNYIRVKGRSSQGTVFGLLNSVTEFVDHKRRSKSDDHRMDSALFGVGAVLKKKALDQAMLLVA